MYVSVTIVWENVKLINNNKNYQPQKKENGDCHKKNHQYFLLYSNKNDMV